MKYLFTILTALSLSLPISAQILASNTQAKIDLRYNSETPEQGKKLFKSGTSWLIGGLVLSALGTTVAILAPDLVNEPVPVNFQEYQEELQYAANSPDRQQVIHERYQEALFSYGEKLTQYEKKVSLIRGIGAGTITVGLTFNIFGVSRMQRAWQE